MVNCGSLLRCALAAVVLVVVAASGAPEKLATCCEQVSTNEITEPILGFSFQEINPPCVKAVVFQTKSRQYCVYPKAAWVLPKIRELISMRRALSTRASSRTSPSTTPTPSSAGPSSSSLLSIITSTSSRV